MSNFQVLRESFKGNLVTPSDAGYSTAIARWARNAERQAAAVAFVKDADDVSLAIRYAKTEGLPIAVRGGGHSSAGASSVENGLVIDLSRFLNTVDINPEHKLAKIGGGAIWETVDKAAIEYGLATVGGTVNHTGVGGLVLGGGYGWLSGSHGLAIDNLIQVTMVVADGSILTASATENLDLFWGIKGGGSNFGVCVEFVLKLYDQRKTVFSGMWIFPPPALERLAQITEEWWTKGPSGKEGMIQVYTRGPDGNPCIVVFPFYNGSATEAKQVYKAFYDLGPVVDACEEVPFEILNSLQNPVAVHGRNVYMKGVAQQNPRIDVAKGLFECMVERSSGPDLTIAVICELFPLDKIKSVAPDAAAFPNRGQQSNVLINIGWSEGDTSEKTNLARETARALAAIISRAEENPLAAENNGYANYEGEEKVSPDRARLLFGANYPRLQQLKKKYDPEMLFSKWFVIEPAE